MIACATAMLWQPAAAQEATDSPAATTPAAADSLTTVVYPDNAGEEPVLEGLLTGDTLKAVKVKRDWNTWRPNPKRAMWLAIALPGAGQIYNRKYWKLPIFYGGIVGCAYAWRWNNMMYHDYSKAYMDIMDDDPSTASYNDFLHLGQVITDSNVEEWASKFKKRKDRYRRWRDMSVFVLIGVYALSVIDAYVDATLSDFDISDDLSLRVAPSVMIDKTSADPLKSSGLGLQCSLSF